MSMTAFDESVLNMHREILALGWVLCQEVTPAKTIAIYQRLRDGKVERAGLVMRGSVFNLEPLTQEKRR